jgi:hypothetical protein
MSDRSRQKPSQEFPRWGATKGASPSESSTSRRDTENSGRSAPPFEPVRPETVALKPSTTLVPSTDTTQALSQILRDLIQTLPRHSNPNRIDISSPGDNLVAGTITPPSEGRPTNPDPKSQQVELPPDEFPAHPVDRSEIAAPVPMDAGANVQNVSDSLGVPIPPRVPLVGSSFEPGSVSLASTDRIDVTASPAGSPPGIVPSSAMGREVVHSIIPAPVDSTAEHGIKSLRLIHRRHRKG